MTERFCSSCGQKVTEHVKFCPGCGQAQTPILEEKTQDTIQNDSEIVKQVDPTPKNSKINKWIYIGVAVVIAIFAYTSFTKSTPEKVTKEFIESVYSFDFETTLGHMSLFADEDLVEEFQWLLEEFRYDPESAKEELRELKKEGYVLKNVNIRDTTKTKDSASLFVDMILENGDQDSGYVELVKESGKWKIVYID